MRFELVSMRTKILFFQSELFCTKYFSRIGEAPNWTDPYQNSQIGCRVCSAERNMQSIAQGFGDNILKCQVGTIILRSPNLHGQKYYMDFGSQLFPHPNSVV